MTSKPIRLATAIVAGFQFVIGSGGLTDVLPPPWPSTLTLINAGLTVALLTYAGDKVTPLSDPRTAKGVPLIPDPTMTGGTDGDANTTATPLQPRRDPDAPRAGQ